MNLYGTFFYFFLNLLSNTQFIENITKEHYDKVMGTKYFFSLYANIYEIYQKKVQIVMLIL